MTSSSPALPRWRRSAVPLLLVAACAGACGSTTDTPRAAAGSSASAASTTSTPTSTSTTSPPVRQVVDGRTLVNATGKTVRVIGLAAPGECWAQAATEFATTTLAGKRITLQSVSGDQVNIGLPDGSDYAETALRNGMARAESTANSALTSAEAVAKQAGLGLWGGECGGKDSSDQAGAQNQKQSGSDDLYFASCDAAKRAGLGPIVTGQPGYGKHLDPDGDGIACDR